MLNLFNVPRQVTLRGNVGTLDATRVVQQFKFGPRGAGDCTERVKIGLKKSGKDRGSQWYAQSANCSHTGHIKLKCGLSGSN